MIKLTKGIAPYVLAHNAAKWTQVILDKLGRGEPLLKSDKGHYSHHEIKSALVGETYGKCAYCESKIRHIAYGDIEHITPKSEVPVLWFDWNNLTLACDICNTSKSDFLGDEDTFIDPYSVDPEDHFWVLGAFLFARPGSDAAAITERVLRLNRTELIERRSERLNMLMRHLEVIERTRDPHLQAILQTDFLAEAESDKEFAALARQIVREARIRGVLPN